MRDIRNPGLKGRLILGPLVLLLTAVQPLTTIIGAYVRLHRFLRRPFPYGNPPELDLPRGVKLKWWRRHTTSGVEYIILLYQFAQREIRVVWWKAG